jgi:hypothetical protein
MRDADLLGPGLGAEGLARASRGHGYGDRSSRCRVRPRRRLLPRSKPLCVGCSVLLGSMQLYCDGALDFGSERRPSSVYQPFAVMQGFQFGVREHSERSSSNLPWYQSG